jgi:hypothetical protein
MVVDPDAQQPAPAAAMTAPSIPETLTVISGDGQMPDVPRRNTGAVV